MVEIMTIVIIGGGISGCYLYYQMKKRDPYSNVIIIEMSNRLGGRLLSYEMEGNVYDMGGLRFSKTSHVLLRSLLDDLEVDYIPITSSLPSDKKMAKMMKGINNIDDRYYDGFSEYAIEHCFNPSKMAIKSGYNILMDDITLRVLYADNKLISDWNRVPSGLGNICDKMVDHKDVMLNKRVVSYDNNTITLSDGIVYDCDKVYYTGQVHDLDKLMGTSYSITSFIPYDAIRIYIPYYGPDIGYVSDLPIRKIMKIGNALMIYSDSGPARILETLMRKKKYDVIKRLIHKITGIKISGIKRSIYHYWKGGIYWYRSHTKKIRPELTCVNSDLSDHPGWIEGSLSMVEELMNCN